MTSTQSGQAGSAIIVASLLLTRGSSLWKRKVADHAYTLALQLR